MSLRERVYDNLAGDGHPLLLAAGQAGTPLADDGIVFFRQALDEVIRGGDAGARFVKQRAAFLLSKRTMLTEAELLDFDDELIRRGISCGGAADMLAAAIFLSLADEEQRGFAELIKTTL